MPGVYRNHNLPSGREAANARNPVIINNSWWWLSFGRTEGGVADSSAHPHLRYALPPLASQQAQRVSRNLSLFFPTHGHGLCVRSGIRADPFRPPPPPTCHPARGRHPRKRRARPLELDPAPPAAKTGSNILTTFDIPGRAGPAVRPRATPRAACETRPARGEAREARRSACSRRRDSRPLAATRDRYNTRIMSAMQMVFL